MKRSLIEAFEASHDQETLRRIHNRVRSVVLAISIAFVIGLVVFMGLVTYGR